MMRALLVILALTGFAPPAPVAAEEGDSMDSALTITSPAFANGEPIPERFTADGANVSPPLEISSPPDGTVTFALVVDDPDAPRGTWVHWVVWNLPASTREIAEDSLPSGAVEGRNSWGRTGYGGPSPPSGTHRYHFKLYAVDDWLQLPKSADKIALIEALEGRVLARAQLMGTYTRR